MRDELRARCADAPAGYQGTHAVGDRACRRPRPRGLLDVPMYQIDALVRRAPSLQRTREGRTPAVRVLTGPGTSSAAKSSTACGLRCRTTRTPPCWILVVTVALIL